MSLGFWRFLRNALIALLVLGVGGWLLLARPVAQPHSNDPAWAFNHGSIGNEQTQGMPYWIWRVLPIVFSDLLPGDQRGIASVGVAWQPGTPLPIGFSQKTFGTIPRVAPNCAFCHQGSYRLDTYDPVSLVSGGAGNRVDAQGYMQFLADASDDDRFKASSLMPAIKARYDMPLWERLTYRYILIPQTRARLKAQAKTGLWAQSRDPWGMGRADMVNMLKFSHMSLAEDRSNGTADIMPLWNLDTADASEQRRPALQWDGLQLDLADAITTGAIHSGVTAKTAYQASDALAGVADFARSNAAPASPFSSHRDPSDPLYVDAADVAAGKEIYQQQCATCHEADGARYRTVITAAEIGTDRARLDAWTLAAEAGLSGYEDGHDWGLDHLQKTNGYLATDLTGLWLRAPYLHNGSVPNLTAMLTAPDQRPAQFWRGSDLVDAANGGFVSTKDGDPYRHAIPVDTTQPGNSNSGHSWGTTLGAADKKALLAYLKTL